MPISRITSKGQVTLPKEVREALDLDKVAILKKVEPFDPAFHGAVAEALEGWNSPEDEEAFDDLLALRDCRRSFSLHGQTRRQKAPRPGAEHGGV